VALTPDGRNALSGSTDGTLKLWHVASGAEKRTLAGHASAVTAVAVSADGRRALSGSTDGRLKLWDVNSGAMLAVVQAHAKPIRSVAVSADARHALSGAEDGTLKLWDVSSKLPLAIMRGHTGVVSAIALSPDAQVALSGGSDDTLKVWDVTSGEPLREFGAREDAASFASLSRSGRLVLSATKQGRVRLWDLASLAQVRSWAAEADGISAAALSPDGLRALTASSDNRGNVALKVWDVASARTLHIFDAGPDLVTSTTFSRHGLHALSGGMLGTLRLWGVEIGRPLRTFVGHNSPVRSVAASPDGRWALSAAEALIVGVDRVKLWDLRSGDELHSFDGFGAAAFSSSRRRALLGSRTGALQLWDLRNMVAVDNLAGQGARVTAIAFSPDVRRAVSAGEDGSLKLWDVDLGVLVRDFVGHHRAIRTVAFSADGERLMSSSSDGTIRIWRVASGASVALVASASDWLAFTDDGYFAASRGGADVAFAVAGLRGVRFDQHTVRNNRPDLLLQRLGLGSPELIADFHARHRRRLRLFGLEEEKVASRFARAPQARIRRVKQGSKTAELTLDIGDEHSELSHYQLFVNGVPLFDGRGKRVKGHRQRLTERVELATGRNDIAVVAHNAAGAASLLDSVVVRHKPTAKSDLYFVGFGVSRYQSQGLSLKYAHKDTVDLGRAFERTGDHYGAVHVHTFVNEQVTVDSIQAAKSALQQAGVDDTVVLFVAGQMAHSAGVPARRLYLTYASDASRLVETAVDFSVVEGLLGASPARRKLMLVDSCASGDRNEIERTSSLREAARRGLAPRTSLALEGGPKAAPRPFLFYRARAIFDDAAARSGAIALYSSSGTEQCYEVDELRNGAFAAGVLRALSTVEADLDGDGWLTVDELADYVGPAVASMTSGLQHPVLDRQGVQQSVRLPMLMGSRVSDWSMPMQLPPAAPPGCLCHLHSGGRAGLPWPAWLVAAALTLCVIRRRRG